MCGIFGIAVTKKAQVNKRLLKRYADLLFVLSESRGKEASGIAFHQGDRVLVYKLPVRATKLIKTKGYARIFEDSGVISSFIGHSRLATNGVTSKSQNNQPVIAQGGTLVHNGIVVNDKRLWKDVLGKPARGELDTMVLPYLFANLRATGLTTKEVISQSYSALEGAVTIAYFPSWESSLVVSTNTGSLYGAKVKALGVVFCSEEYILKSFLAKSGLSGKVFHVGAGRGMCVNLLNEASVEFTLGKKATLKNKLDKKLVNSIFDIKDVSDRSVVNDNLALPFNNDITSLKRHNFDKAKIASLRRCKKCILPETMPFLKFDAHGVCNYCTNHQKINYRGRGELLSDIKKYRRNDGRADCILAFSGGRDSSYGLHFIKKELGLNPIAYTYDWGMCTDVARRNQYRLTGKLGVEHIIVSADIVKKREYIRQNIEAWLKAPDLGMVPLFMEGDKQNEFYINQLARRTGIDLVIYCRGNELENEEFKWGYCGITNATPGGVIHNLSFTGKIKLLTYWGSRYITNPSYINSSVFDTLFGFFSTYMDRHDYLYLWHYIKWDEEKIVSTLINKYGWEVNPETKATWRIDDGTPAFYNYIYLASQGFTENDTFRSNQIREGIIDRQTALTLVARENKPRYQSLKWYFDAVGIDGDRVLTTVDKFARFSARG